MTTTPYDPDIRLLAYRIRPDRLHRLLRYSFLAVRPGRVVAQPQHKAVHMVARDIAAQATDQGARQTAITAGKTNGRDGRAHLVVLAWWPDAPLSRWDVAADHVADRQVVS